MNLAECATAKETLPLRDTLRKIGVLEEVEANLRTHDIALEHVVGPCRLKHVGRARQWVAHVVRELSVPQHSWSEMATLFRRGDHTTILHAARKGAQLVPAYAPLPTPFYVRKLHKKDSPARAGESKGALQEGPPEACTLIARFVAELAAQHFGKGRTEIGDELFRVAVIVGTKTEEQERTRWMKRK